MNSPRVILRACPVLALLSVLAGATVHAAEDAGTQSVFAYGAGNRALAMGGASIAAGDDVSAIFWNPAGLAHAGRAQFQLAQSGDIGAGFREGFGAVAKPDWRWGTLALSWRHFGASGIEVRDDRNNVVGGEASLAEDEMALAYARSFGPAWDVGATLKNQHQSLAGYSGNGIGVDLGLRLRPAEAMAAAPAWLAPWTFGVAVRNAIQPAIRLDQQSVTDPVAIRAGLAVCPATALGDLVLDVDVEQVSHTAARVRAGFELSPAPGTALRFGLDRGQVTAGMGLRWQDTSLDYAFVNGAFSPTHRLGVSFAFGRSGDESRAAARQAEDDALQRRLAGAFRERQAAQVRELLDRAAASEAESRFDDALDALGAAQTLFPEDADVARAQQRCLHAKASDLESRGELAAAAVTYELALTSVASDSIAAAGVARCRAEGDRRASRTEAIRARFGEAMDAFAAGNLTGARDGFTQVLTLAPADRDAAEMLARTRLAIRRKAAGALDQATRLMRAGALADAAPLLDQAEALDPGVSGLAEARTLLARLRRPSADSPRASARPTAVVPVAKDMSDHELEALYQRGLEAARAQQQDAALRYWELVWSARPGYRNVRENLKREYLARGMEAFAGGRLEEAVSQWEKVLRVDPNDARARGYLARAQQQMTRSREILGGSR